MRATEKLERKNKETDKEDEYLWHLEEAIARSFRGERGAILN